MIHFSRRGKYTESPLLIPDLLLEFLVCFEFVRGGLDPETLAETIESGPLCITDLFQNSLFLIYNYFPINFLILYLLYIMQLFSAEAKIFLEIF
jgi:hypothetical protein